MRNILCFLNISMSPSIDENLVWLIGSLNKIHSSEEAEEVESFIFTIFMKLTGARGGSFIEYRNNTWYGKIIHGNQYLLEQRNQVFALNEHGPLNQALENQLPIYISNIDSEQGRIHPSGYPYYIGKSTMVFPLLHCLDQSDKFITLHSPDKKAFTKEDFKIGMEFLSEARQSLNRFFMRKWLNSKFQIKDETFLFELILFFRHLQHNLANVLTTAWNSVYLMESKTDPSFQEKIFSQLKACIHHMMELIKTPYPCYPDDQKKNDIHSLSQIVRSTLLLFLPESQKKIELSPLLREESDSDLIRCNQNEIEQVLVNLIKNSLEAVNENESVRLFLDQSSVQDIPGLSSHENLAEHYYCLSIKDQGCGMDPNMLVHLFSPFSTTKKYGTGLGLNSVMRVLKKNNAFIHAESDYGQGTVFKLYFPCL
ncbi:MAG: HAMP domain-containing histidine kinase [Candidatus Aureabacteria bacterium]|nr:HAMP domain-containing histidine kinase [Candidatus Auribacterota bacterium]